MKNIELLFNLNKNTKKYVDDALSYLDYFINSDKDISHDDAFAYSLLSTIKNDKELNNILIKNNLTIENVLSYLKIDDKDIRYKLSEDSKYIQNNDLSIFFSNLADRIKYSNSFKEDLLLYDLKPYQLFDEITEQYYDSLNKLCNYIGIDFDNVLISELYKKINDLNKDFKKEIIDEDVIEYDYVKFVFKNNKSYLVLKDNYYLQDLIIDGLFIDKKDNMKTNDVNDLMELLLSNHLYKINSICGYKGNDINKETINRILSHLDGLDAFSIKLTDSDDKDIVFNITFDSNRLLGKDIVNTYEKDISVNDLSDKKDEKVVYDYTPNLDKYGYDLTKEEYLKDPSVGRDEKIKEIEKVLLYPEKDKSVIITGEAGCGKTALVKGLAYRIKKGNVPESLKNLKIYSIDTTTLVAGTRYAGTLEEKMNSIFNDASSSKNIIIFIDEIHRTLGAGKTEGDDNTISEMLKPYLDSGKVRVIGATTNNDYNEYMLEDDAFRTRFKRIKLDEPSKDVIYDVVDNLITSYNKFNYSKLLVSDEERDSIINLLMNATDKSHRNYLDGASNPRLILDIIKDAYAIAALDDRTEVTREDIAYALLSEEKIYKSAREEYAKKIRSNDNNKKLCKIINIKDYINKE